MDTKTALMDSAETAVRKNGYDGFSYADLATAVGIRKASIHYHFPSKSDLALQLMQRYREDLQLTLETFDRELPNAGSRLKAQVERYRVAAKDGTQLCMCVAFSLSAESLAEDIMTEVAEYRNQSLAWLSGIYRIGQSDGSISNVLEPSAEAAACLATLEGAHLAARAEGNIRGFDAATKQLLRRVADK